jgi:hypothetical protein
MKVFYYLSLEIDLKYVISNAKNQLTVLKFVEQFQKAQ